MKMTGFRYHRPSSLDEATALLAELGDDAKVLAGGQSLLPLMAMRLATPGHVVDVGGLRLDHIDVRDGSAVIGALVRHSAAERSAAVAQAAPLVAAALPHVGHRAIRNRGTVCGSLAHADPAAELPAVALAADARFTVCSVRGMRTIDAGDFFTGYLSTALAADELLTEVSVPAAEPMTGAAVHEVSRRHGDFALVGAAVQVTRTGAGTIADARVALFGVAPTPLRLPEVEAQLAGATCDRPSADAVADLVRRLVDPVADVHATAQYRRHVAGVVASRALIEAFARTGGGDDGA